MNSMKRIRITTAVLLMGLSVAAQQQSLSLEQAVEMGVKNSKPLKQSNAKLEEAISAVTIAKQEQLPNASVSGSYLRLSAPSIDMKSSSSGGSGGSGSSGGSMPKVNQAMYGIANVSVPLFQGGKLRFGIESARYLQQAAELDVDAQKEEVILNIIQAYVNLYKADAAVKLVQENLQQSQQRVTDFSNLEQNGLLARNDLMKAELQSSNTELSLIEAKNQRDLANASLNILLGLPEDAQVTAQIDTSFSPSDLKALVDYQTSAMNDRAEKQSLDFRKQAAESQVKVTRAALLPGLSLSGGYVAADIPNFLTITNAVNIGVGVNYSISSLWKNKAKVNQANARVKQMVTAEQILDDQLKLQVRKEYLGILNDQKKEQVYQSATDQATENYRIVKNKYDNSLATTTDLLEADVAQLQARLNQALAKADMIVDYHKLLLATGQLSNQFQQ